MKPHAENVTWQPSDFHPIFPNPLKFIQRMRSSPPPKFMHASVELSIFTRTHMCNRIQKRNDDNCSGLGLNANNVENPMVNKSAIIPTIAFIAKVVELS